MHQAVLHWEKYRIDAQGRILHLMAYDSTGATLPRHSWRMEYAEASGRLTHKATEGYSVDFTYDSLGRMLTRRKAIIVTGKPPAALTCTRVNLRFEYLPSGRSDILTTADGTDCEPQEQPAEIRNSFDEGGLLIEQSYWRMHGQPLMQSQLKGVKSVSWEYDKLRRAVRRDMFYTARGQSTRELFTYNDEERRMTVRTEYVGGAFTPSNGCV